MAEIDGVTLMMAIQAVDEVIGRLTEATSDEDEADPDDQQMLMDYRRAAGQLEVAYRALCKVEGDLPAYEGLVNR